MKTIVLTGGGTAGHCAPHFAILQDIKTHFDKVYYIGSVNGIEKQLVSEKSIPYYAIPTIKLKRSLTLSNLKIPFALLKSVKAAKKILKELKPSVVFSKGGYVGLPVTIAAKTLKIPVVIHESDYTLGLANKIASRFADKTLTTFYETAKDIKNGVYVGSPLRQELFVKTKRNYKQFGFYEDKPTLLITGGSSGAQAINKLVLENLEKLTKKYNVFHIVGKGNLPNIKTKGYYSVEFIDMAIAYNMADLCISRAGSNTAFELVALKIPTLFIPLPQTSSRGDQIQNAKYFYSKGLCHYVLEEELTIDSFASEIDNLYNNKDRLTKNLKKCSVTSANNKISKILVKY